VHPDVSLQTYTGGVDCLRRRVVSHCRSFLILIFSHPFPESGPCSSAGISLTGTSGNFSSPNYPLNYPNSKTCRWKISVPEGYRVKLTFDSFQLETCIVPSVCTCDYVRIRDGNDQNSDELETFCGSNTPLPVLSSRRFMWVEFHADSNNNEEGFRASYTAVGKLFSFHINCVPKSCLS